MKIILVAWASPPCCNYMACAVVGRRLEASPLHSHRTHAPPGWFYFFVCFVLLLFQSVESLQCRKALTCQLIWNTFPCAGPYASCQAALYSVLCTIKKFAFSLPSAWNPPLSCPQCLILKQAEATWLSLSFSLSLPIPLSLSLSCQALPRTVKVRVV